jgi:hypothetical protein
MSRSMLWRVCSGWPDASATTSGASAIAVEDSSPPVGEMERLVRRGDAVDEGGVDRPRGDLREGGARIDAADNDLHRRVPRAGIPESGGEQLWGGQGTLGDPYLPRFVGEVAELSSRSWTACRLSGGLTISTTWLQTATVW